jgi:hypothetical protein
MKTLVFNTTVIFKKFFKIKKFKLNYYQSLIINKMVLNKEPNIFQKNYHKYINI